MPRRVSIYDIEIAAPSNQKGKCQHNILEAASGYGQLLHRNCSQSWTQTSWTRARTGGSVQGPMLKILTPFSHLLLNSTMPLAHGTQQALKPTSSDPTSLLSSRTANISQHFQEALQIKYPDQQCMCVHTRLCVYTTPFAQAQTPWLLSELSTANSALLSSRPSYSNSIDVCPCSAREGLLPRMHAMPMC